MPKPEPVHREPRTRPLLRRLLSRLVRLVPGGFPFHTGTAIRPLFIIGSGRSGMTLLRRALVASSQIHIPPETYVLGPTIDQFSRVRFLSWREVVNHTLANFEYHPDFRYFEISLRELASELYELENEQRSLAYVIDAFYRFHGRKMGSTAERWGDKTPYNTFFLEPLDRVFPSALYIHMLRDGCDYVASALAMGRHASVEEAALHWKKAVNPAHTFENRHPTRCMTIRYEDLVNSPEMWLKSISHFIDIDFRNEMVTSEAVTSKLGDAAAVAHHRRVFDPIDRRSIGSGRRSLSPEDRRVIESLIGGELRKFGYPPCSS